MGLAVGDLGPDAASGPALRDIAGKRLTGEGEIHLAADSERSQEQNRNAVIERLITMIRAAIHEPKTAPQVQALARRKAAASRFQCRRGQIKSGRQGKGEE